MTESLLSKFDELKNIKISKERNKIIIEAEPNDIVKTCRIITNKLGIHHLVTITGVDEGEKICIIYHFWGEKNFINVLTKIEKTSPRISSITNVVPGAIFYESEIHDMLGVFFEGNPMMNSHLLLPDTYPLDMPPPLRKEANIEEIRRRMNLE
ncbi:MAG: NADH-quinone oxidoreductase subunit C [Nitrososphaerota archaeon]